MRVLPSAAVLLAALCAAATGCTVVSPPPPGGSAARPGSSASPGSPGTADGRTVQQAPGTRAQGVTGSDADPARPEAPSTAPRVRVPPAADPVLPGDRRVPGARRPRSSVPVVRRPVIRPDVCRLGRTYGGWSSGSTAEHVCREAYGR